MTDTAGAASAGVRRPAVPRTAWTRLAVYTAIAALLQADGTIVAVALPSVGAAFDVSAGTAAWLMTTYFAVYAVGLFPGGRLVDRFGPGAVALAGLAVFCAGTLTGALAGSFGVLVGSRVLQGAGAGLASPAALAGAVSGFPAERRGTALGIWGAASGLSNLVGPLLGGVLTEVWGWRANWWALLPLGLAPAVCVLRWARSPAEARRMAPGAAESGQPSVPGPAGTPDPAVPSTGEPGSGPPEPGPALPGGRPSMGAVRGASAVAALTFAVMIGSFYLVEQYLQHAAGYGVLRAALAPMVVAVCIGAAGPVAGRLTDRYGERLPAAAGFVACAAACAAYAVPGTAPHGLWLLPGGVLLGAGLGLLFPSTSRAALNSVPRSLHGRASSLLSFGRLAGAACGTALAGLAFHDGVTTSHLRTALTGGAVLAAVGAVLAARWFRHTPAEG
ncbi:MULTISPECIES: MFS transporter [Streptomyces]|uniref:MFS transporter n=1 Tax=Streptomyces TaxID=1883 RepID=UPI00163D1D89|nr:MULTISPECIES: MFS transporter [Streptomyces]MBC2875496.1 MFS transporter [Streptomyces sp. TYQ1024]UBI35735.1 MFS transporter [Streptomyces mobaraensis]UKW28328.1 MFS transporter [Streptomyces sp. TYQ1024]